MRVQDVMSAKVKTVGPNLPAEVAWTMMARHGCHHLVVTDGDRVVGILSNRDAGGRHGEVVRRHCAVGDLMTESVVVTSPETTVRRAANLMRGRSLGALVVVEDGRLRGLVTVSDLLELIGRGLERGASSARRRQLSHRVPHQRHRRVTAAW
jgi:CBS domain-containing protein